MTRYERTEDILRLALALRAPGPGLCLEEISQRFGVGRRTAERMCSAVGRIFPDLHHQRGRNGRKYWKLASRDANALAVWTMDEMRSLERAVKQARETEGGAQAEALETAVEKVRALMDPAGASAGSQEAGHDGDGARHPATGSA